MVSRFRAVAVVVLQMPTSPIRILAVDDHPLILNGVRDLIANHQDLVLVGEASTAKDAIEKYRGLRPDVTLMDIQMPIMDGIEATIAIRREFPTAKLIMLTTYDGDEDIFQCLSQGAKGYLLKDAPRQEILSAIRAVSEDRPYTSSTVAAKALQRMAKPSLTQRELGVLQLVAQGRSNKDIARRLSITEGTAKTHVKAILTKLDAISRTEAVAVAHKRGLIHL